MSTGEKRREEGATLMLELKRALDVVFGADVQAMNEWLHEPLPALGGESPLWAIAAGDGAAVLALLANAESGTFS